MHLRSVLLICWSALLFNSISALRGPIIPDCSIPINDLPHKEPVYLYNHSSTYEFVLPNQGRIELQTGQKIVALCADPKNAVVLTNANYTTTTCVKDNTFTVLKRQYNFNEISCRSNVRGIAQHTSQTCGNGKGHIINIGYEVTRSSFLTLIKICFDQQRAEALYSINTIYGDAIANSEKESSRPIFNTAGIQKSASSVSAAYKQANQKPTFSQILGPTLAEKYINTVSFLSRGHLAPDGDFLFASWQFTTYYYINVCPQWQTINGGNWLSVESTVRKVAAMYGKNFNIITGTYGILTMQDSNNKAKEIYLDPQSKRIPVPLLVWKIVHSEENQHAIALVSTNNPYMKSLPADHILCKNICSQYGWHYPSWTANFTKGYIYCCDVNELKQTIHNIPDWKYVGVLRGLK